MYFPVSVVIKCCKSLANEGLSGKNPHLTSNCRCQINELKVFYMPPKSSEVEVKNCIKLQVSQKWTLQKYLRT